MSIARGTRKAAEAYLRYLYTPEAQEIIARNYYRALNWHLTGNLKLLFNYIRAKGTNSPLVAASATENGTTAKVDIFQTRLQLDF